MEAITAQQVSMNIARHTTEGAPRLFQQLRQGWTLVVCYLANQETV